MDSKKEVTVNDVQSQSASKKYGFTVQQLQELQSSHTLADPNKQIEMLKENGGVSAIAAKLGVDLETGLPKDADFADRMATFGANVIEEPPITPFYEYLWEAWKEPIVVMLSIFAIVSIVTNLAFPEDEEDPHRETAWIEGGAVILAVLLVCFVSAGNNWSMERQFRTLNKKKNDRQVKILRGGKEEMIGIEQLVVGDVVILETGDYVPADGIYIEGHGLAADESAMTGESKEIKKGPKSPFLISGTKVAEGRGKFLVICVGMASEWGIMYSKLQTEKEPTPMQVNLAVLAKLVGYIGTIAAGLVFIVLVIRYIVDSVDDPTWVPRNLIKLLRIIIICMALIVVAVPEGLPLAVTICLAYSTKAMLKDNNLVRQLAACETMGGATNICSDKTGTLTENRMTVTNVWACNQLLSPKSAEDIVEKDMKEIINKEVLKVLCESCAVNSSAFLKVGEKTTDKVEFFGSKTECALLLMCHRLNFSYEDIRKNHKVVSIVPFSSDRKRMNTIATSDKYSRLYTKGASEIVLGLCSTYLDKDGSKQKLTAEKKEELNNTINKLASEGLRTLSIAYKDIDSTDVDVGDKEKVEELEKDCIMIAIVGIKDPLRPEVPAAIARCKDAGIIVRMVTGDNKLTATRIAQDCGILAEDGIAMEGPDFRVLSDAQIDAILPKLRVLARSTPSDKYKLVERLKENNEVVAVTGDGTNDAPALKKANVGMAMGIAGTEIAKEAAAIIIMDDNFASIVKAVLWGRSVRQNIQKFIQFQLTINFVALTAAFIAAVSGAGQPLRPIQLLWINLIQDSLAALALATEKPTEKLLDEKPAGKAERLITPTMWRNMLSTALYQLAVVFFLLFAGDSVFDVKEDLNDDGSVRDKDDDPTRHYTMIYNTFVFMQIFNEINCRKLDRAWNCFEGFFDNWLCSAIVIGTVVLQVILVQWAGIVMFTYPLQWQQWLVSIGFGLSLLLFGVINRVLIPIPNFDWLRYTRKGLKQIRARNGVLDKKAEVELPFIEASSSKTEEKKEDYTFKE